MRMTTVASKCAAVLCAAAVMVPAVAAAAPAAFAKFDTGIVASAADFEYAGTYFTGDLYCAVGDTFTMEVTLGSQDKQYGTDGFTYEWYSSSDKITGTNDKSKFNWTKMSYTTKSISVKMTSAMNGMHIYAVKVNKSTGEKTETPMRTVSCTAAKASLGTATAETKNGKTYVTVPFYMTGLTNRQISAMTISLKVDKNVFESVSFDQAVNGLSGLDNYITSTGEYRNSMFSSTTPATLGSDNLVGEFVLAVKSGATYEGSKATLTLDDAMLSGDTVSGNIVYGTTPVTATISTSSTGAKYPVASVQVQGNAFKLTWTTVPNAQKYVVGYTTNGKTWKVAKTVDANTTSFTYKNTPKGTYYLVVGAYVGGKVDTSNLAQRAVKLVIS